MLKGLFALVAIVFSVSNADACQPTMYKGVLPMAFVNGWHNGDTCLLADLPPPFNTIIPTTQGPGIFAYSWTYEDKQYGFFYMTVNEAGEAAVTFEYSNGKQTDGDTFTAAVVFRNREGKPVYQLSSQVGVDARFFGNDKKGFDYQKIVQSPEWWRSIASLQFFHGRYQKEDDQKNWNAAIELIKKYFEDDGGDDGSSENQ